MLPPGIPPNACEDGDSQNRPRLTPGSFLIHVLSSFKSISSFWWDRAAPMETVKNDGDWF